MSSLTRVKVSGDKVNLAEFAAPQMDKHILITLHAGEQKKYKRSDSQDQVLSSSPGFFAALLAPFSRATAKISSRSDQFRQFVQF